MTADPPDLIAVLPARLQSSRLPEKLLLAETGKTLLQHTYEAVRAAGVTERVVVATDSDRIADVSRNFGAEVVLTSPDCPSGSDRVREAIDRLGLPDDAGVLNVQGDEPEISGEALRSLAAALAKGAAAATCAFAITPEEALDPNLVKVVVADDERALYFSRARIPFVRDATGMDERDPSRQPYWGHAGVYAFQAATLRRFANLPPSPLERCEKLEQLRLLEHGIPLQVVRGERPGVGVDTREDYERFLHRWRSASNT